MNGAGGTFEDANTHNFSEPEMKSTVVKRSVKIDGHRTSVSLEDAFWFVLKEIASVRKITSAELVTFINAKREYPNLSSAIRAFVLNHIQVNEGTENALPDAETVHPAKSPEESPPPY